MGNVKKSPVKKPVMRKAVPSAKAATAKKPSMTSAPRPPKNQGLVKAAVPASPAPVAKPAVKKTSAKAVGANAAEIPVSDAVVKRPIKLLFIEVKPGAERVIKRGDKSLAVQVPVDIQARRKDTAAEETSEELVERIERELQHQSFFKRNSLKPQMCTKCGINVVIDRFTIDRELGYCGSCAEILRLGATKEARRMEFNPSMKKEGEAAAPAAPAEIAEAAEVPVEGDEEPVPDID